MIYAVRRAIYCKDMIQTPYEALMEEILNLQDKYDFQVVGVSGTCYSDVPKEVWDLVPPANKRMVLK